MRNRFELLVCILVVVGALMSLGGLWFHELRVFCSGIVVGGLLPIMLAGIISDMKY